MSAALTFEFSRKTALKFFLLLMWFPTIKSYFEWAVVYDSDDENSKYRIILLV
jgi:hypothetical protein